MVLGFPICGNSETQAPFICGHAISLGRSLNSLFLAIEVETDSGQGIHNFYSHCLVREQLGAQPLDSRGAVIITTGSVVSSQQGQGIRTHGAASHFCHRLPSGHQISGWLPSYRRQPKVSPRLAPRIKSMHSG